MKKAPLFEQFSFFKQLHGFVFVGRVSSRVFYSVHQFYFLGFVSIKGFPKFVVQQKMFVEKSKMFLPMFVSDLP